MEWGDSITKQAVLTKGKGSLKDSLKIASVTENRLSGNETKPFPQHKLSWKSVGSPSVLEKRKKREAMMVKFQQQLVKVRAYKKPAQEPRILKNGVINIENSDDISSIYSNHTLSYESTDNTQEEHSNNDNYSSALLDWKELQEKMASDTAKLKKAMQGTT